MVFEQSNERTECAAIVFFLFVAVFTAMVEAKASANVVVPKEKVLFLDRSNVKGDLILLSGIGEGFFVFLQDIHCIVDQFAVKFHLYKTDLRRMLWSIIDYDKTM